jgi:DNA repair protein RadD
MGEDAWKLRGRAVRVEAMSNAWGVLGKAQLQQLIGENLITRLEYLLPALHPNTFNSDAIYSQENLAGIFESFRGAQALRDKKFRQRLFNALPAATIDRIASETNTEVGGGEFSEKVRKLVSRGWKSRAFAEGVASVMGLSEDVLPNESVLPEPERIIPQAEQPYKQLLDYQSPIYHEAKARLATPRQRFIIQMPTGSGKTRTAMEIASSFILSRPSERAVVWLAHSEELCEQAFDSFLEVWPHLANQPLRIVRCWGDAGVLPASIAEPTFIVASFQKLHAVLSRSPEALSALVSEMGLVIVDEAHRVLAPSYSQVTKALCGSNTRVVGLTATPGRSASEDTENRALADFFFGEIISIPVQNETVIEHLRRRGVLSHTSYVPLMTERNFDLSPKEKAYLAKYFDLPPGFLTKLASDDVRNFEIVKRLEAECTAGQQILFFGCSVEHSQFICAIMTLLGFGAAHIDGTTPKPRRRKILQRFKDQEFNLLCNYGVLSTGFDAPKTNVVFIARPTSSIVLYSQMIGRGLRGPQIGGTERCKVIDVRDNINGFSDENAVYSYFDEYYEGGSE